MNPIIHLIVNKLSNQVLDEMDKDRTIYTPGHINKMILEKVTEAYMIGFQDGVLSKTETN